MKSFFSIKHPALFSRLLKQSFLLLLLLVGFFNSHANHIIGGDLSYTYTGTGNIYTINLNIYGDCAGSTFGTLAGSTHTINIYHGTTLYTSVTTTAFGSGTEVTPVCPSLSGSTRCSSASSTIPGIKIFNATTTIALAPSSDWRIVFNGDYGTGSSTVLGRSTAIGNISSGTTSIIHLEATLDNSSGQNSSPVFTNTTPPYYCISSTIYNPAATDADRDSLSLALVPVIDATTGSAVTYNSGYSATVPIHSSTGCTLNSSTGQLSFTPDLVQISCVDYKISEIRSGKVVGTSMREMNFVILPCSNNPPSATPSTIVGGKSTGTYTLSSCTGTTFSFNLAPTDPEGDKITMSASGLPSGASFSVTGNGGSSPLASFSWNTTGVIPGTYIFYINYKDDACPLSYSQTIAYSITINASPIAPTVVTPVYYCNGAVATALTATGTNLQWYTSATGGTASTTAPIPGTSTSSVYYVTQTSAPLAGTCESPRASIAVNINPIPSGPTAASPISYCKGAIATALTATGTNLQWYASSTGGVGTLVAPTPATTNVGTTQYYVSQIATLPGSCESNRTAINVIVDTIPLAPIVVSPVYLCLGAPAATPLAATISTTGSSLLWYTVATGGVGSSIAPIPSSATVGSTTYYVSQTCPSIGFDGPRAAINATVQPLPVVSLNPLGLTGFALCRHDSTTLNTVAPTAVNYQWSRNLIPISGATAATLKVGATGTYSVTVQDIYGCTNNQSVTMFNDTLALPTLSPIDIKICDGVTIMLYCSPAITGYKYEWFQNNVAVASAATTASAIPVNVAAAYKVRVTDIYGCIDTTNESDVSTYPTILKPTILRFDPVLKLNNTYSYYQWYRNNKAISGANSMIYTMLYDGLYYAEVTDVNGCSKYSDTVTIVNLSVANVQGQQSDLRIYPNPSMGIVNIESAISVNVSVTDLVGRVVLQQAKANEVDLSNFADGMYLFRITDEAGTVIKMEKINKQSSQR